MKRENNWRYKSLQNLYKWDCDSPDEASTFLAKRCLELRKIPVNEFTIEDLRIMIGQNIGLDYLIPLALEELDIDLFCEGDYYPGDMLQSVLNIDKKFWQINKELFTRLQQIIADRETEIESQNISLKKFKQHY